MGSIPKWENQYPLQCPCRPPAPQPALTFPIANTTRATKKRGCFGSCAPRRAAAAGTVEAGRHPPDQFGGAGHAPKAPAPGRLTGFPVPVNCIESPRRPVPMPVNFAGNTGKFTGSLLAIYWQLRAIYGQSTGNLRAITGNCAAVGKSEKGHKNRALFLVPC
eukprot:gene14517-biopygen11158